MSTLVLGERPPELEQLLARRRALGQDLFDEVWEGSYHAAPAPSFSHGRVEAQLAVVLHPPAERAGLVMTGPFDLGENEDYRVPDQGWHRVRSGGTRLPTAALVVEVVSPGDQSYEKFAFYAAHHVDEALVVDPALRTVRLWRLGDGRYDETGRSDLLDLDVADVAAAIDWP